MGYPAAKELLVIQDLMVCLVQEVTKVIEVKIVGSAHQVSLVEKEMLENPEEEDISVFKETEACLEKEVTKELEVMMDYPVMQDFKVTNLLSKS
jgi:hypothetical protein